MLVFRVASLTALIVNLALGVLVFHTQPHRRANRFFFLSTILFSIWLGCLSAGSFTSDPDLLMIWVRLSGATSLVALISLDLLSWAVSHPASPLRSDRKRFLTWLALLIPTVGLTLSPWHVVGTQLSDTGFVEAIYGPLQGVYIAIWILSLGLLSLRYVRDMRGVEGIEKAELQFLLLATVTVVGTGIGLAQIGPLFTRQQTLVPYTPLCVILFDAVIAYGIATRRILSVDLVLRRLTAWILLAAYLSLVYFGVVFVSGNVLPAGSGNAYHPGAYLLGAIVIVFSLAPANGWMQRFTNRLFVNLRAFDMAETLAMAHESLQSIRTTDALLHRFGKIVASSLGTDRVQVYLCENDGLTLYFPQPSANPCRLEPDHPVVRAFHAKAQTFSVDALRRRRLTPQSSMLLDALKTLDAQLAVPIRVEQRLRGALLLGRRLTGRFYNLAEQQALALLCGELGVAIENARLYTEAANARIYNDILLDALSNGVVAVRTNGRVSVMNREARRICGLAMGPGTELLITQLPRPMQKILRQVLDSGVALKDREERIENKDQAPIPVRISASLFQSHTGERLGALAVVQDVTDLHQLEAQVRRTDRLSSLGTLATGMAHEIKNPLVSIQTFAQLLPERFDDPAFRDTFSSLIVREVRRIDGIVERLLSFAAPSPPCLAPTHLHRMFVELLTLVDRQFENDHIRVDRHFGAQHDCIQGDSDQLSQAFLNFLLNAEQAMPDGGVLSLTTTEHYAAETGSMILIAIRDTGIGIPEASLKHVFDPFFTTNPQGSGLGLSVAHGIIQEHGGSVGIESVEGKGTTVLVKLPLNGEDKEV